MKSRGFKTFQWMLPVTKADKTFNSRHPIPGRDPVKESAKYQRYFDAVDERMGA